MVFAFVIYFAAFLGSISFGYIVMRAAFPDTRALPRETKLGLSSIIGLIITFLAFVTSLLLPDAFLAFIPAYSIALYGFFELRSRYFAPATMRVAVPVIRMEAPAIAPPVRKPAAEEEEIAVLERSMREAAARRVAKEEIAFPKREIAFPRKEIPEIRPREEPEEAKVLPPKEELLAPEEEFEELEEKLRKKAEMKERAELPEIPKKGIPILPQKPEEAPMRFPPKMEIPIQPVAIPKAEAAPRGPGFMERRRQRYEERRAGRPAEPRPEVVSAVAQEMRRPRRRREGKAEAVAAAPPTKEELTIEEIAGGLETAGSIGELSELEGLGSLGEMETKGEVSLEDIAGLSSVQEMPRERGVGCPNCGDLKSTIVYCPYDGKAFCTHCAKSAQQKQGLIFYTCPHCSKEVVVKKE